MENFPAYRHVKERLFHILSFTRESIFGYSVCTSSNLYRVRIPMNDVGAAFGRAPPDLRIVRVRSHNLWRCPARQWVICEIRKYKSRCSNFISHT
jgi:hypothetical protein